MEQRGMKSLAYVPQDKNLEVCCDVPSGPNYPSLYVDSKQIPEIEDWEVGLEYELTVRVKMSSYSVSERGDGRSNAELTVESYERETEKSLD